MKGMYNWKATRLLRFGKWRIRLKVAPSLWSERNWELTLFPTIIILNLYFSAIKPSKDGEMVISFRWLFLDAEIGIFKRLWDDRRKIEE